MALNPTRVRRFLSLSCYLSSRQRLPSTTVQSLSCLSQFPVFPSQIPSSSSSSSCYRLFHSTRFSLSSSRTFNDVEKIDPDTILFEGCDYKHWLIVMDFGKDPQQRPSPEQMVETYVQTLAKVVGSVEEAKKRMYACSTTTYTGFQAEMDEETSNKFEGMPGVVFILPDSYIDPVHKEYGGDKYVNGTIIPRPPPVQYGRVRRGRQNDQRPSNQMPYQQGNHSYNQHGPMPREGRGMPQPGAPQGQHFQHNYGPPGQGGRSNPVPNYSEQQRGGYQGGGNTYVPPNQGNYNHQYTHPHQTEHHPSDQGYIPRGRVSNHQVGGFNHPQGQMKNSPGDHVALGYPGDNSGNYGPPNPARRPDGQAGAGFYQQNGDKRYMQGPNASFDQGGSVGYPQPENQRFSQAPDEQNRSYAPASQTGMNQGRF